jgi:alpha-1,2-mannosyltransferase
VAGLRGGVDAEREYLPGCGACAALYGASILILLASKMGHGWGFVDLAVYRYGAQGVLDGAHLYALRFPGALAFTYPPIAALLFLPLTLVRMAVLEPVLTAGSMVLLPVTLGCALRLAPIRDRVSRERAIRIALLASAAAVWLEPVWTTLRYGQIDVIVAALVLYDLSRPDSARWKGVGIGLATGLKLTPGIFAVYLLLTRRYRAAAVSGAVFAATVAVGFLALGKDSSEYWSGAFGDPSRVGRIENAANQSLRGAYARLLHTLDVQPWWLCTAALVGMLGMALAVRAGRRGDDASGFSLCALSALLVSPISWSHHWVMAVPALLLFALGARRLRSRARLAAAAIVAAVGWLHVIWWVPVNHPRHSELHLDAAQLVFSDAYVLIGLAALALTALKIRPSSARLTRALAGAHTHTRAQVHPKRKPTPRRPTRARGASRS